LNPLQSWHSGSIRWGIDLPVRSHQDNSLEPSDYAQCVDELAGDASETEMHSSTYQLVKFFHGHRGCRGERNPEKLGQANRGFHGILVAGEIDNEYQIDITK